MKELMGDVRISEELLEIVKPIIEPQILLREQSALEKGMKSGIEISTEQYCQYQISGILPSKI